MQLKSDSMYDQLNVTGAVNLAAYGVGADVNVTLEYMPSIGQQFTLINNDGTEAVVGTFNGYAEGDLVLVGDVAFRISYAGGTGNDVVLTRFSGVSLMDGATSYDSNCIALDGILSEWASSRRYASRGANLQGIGSGNAFANRRNSDYLQPATTVFNDGKKDKLRGGAGRDLFFAELGGKSGDTLWDNRANEIVVRLL